MKTIFITLLLIVAGAVSSFTTAQAQDGFCLRKMQVSFDVNPNNPDIQYLRGCTLTIPDGTPNYYITNLMVSNYTHFEYNYNSPEEMGINLNLEYPYTDRIKVDVAISSTAGDIQYRKYDGGMGMFAIRCETPIQEGQKYLIKIKVGY